MLRAGLVMIAVLAASCGRWNFADRDGSGSDAGGDGSTTGDGVVADAPPFFDASLPCTYTCTVDLPSRSTTCQAPITLDVTPMMEATAVVDMTGRTELAISGAACNSVGYTLHLGDSPSNNGGGGDAAQFSNDAEVYVQDGTLWLHGNDYMIGVLGSSAGFFTTTGCTDFELRVRDQLVEGSAATTFVKPSPYALRVNPPVDDEGTPDALWYLGLNRTYADALRNGDGLAVVSLCLR